MAGLGKSGSASAIATAGAMLSHIPKRATQHGIYMPSHEVPPTSLKPGQASLTRQLYTEEVKDHKETYLESDMSQNFSVYARDNQRVPKDYTNTRPPIVPAEPEDDGGHMGTGHWKSEYRSNVNDAARFDSVLHRQNGPSYQVANPPTCVSGGPMVSQYQEQLGTYGSNPRDKLPPGETKMPTFKTALTVGTAKGTFHIPGYQGFMATNTANPKVAKIANGEFYRSTDKSNMTEVFHQNIVGYAGHKPSNARNDRGAFKVSTTLTDKGRNFQPPPPESYY